VFDVGVIVGEIINLQKSVFDCSSDWIYTNCF
jgi:hypothetical protein